MSTAHPLELRIIPPVVTLAHLTLNIFLGRSTYPTLLRFRVPGSPILAALLAALGLSTAASGIIQFRAKKTTVNPRNPRLASSLVTEGIYSVTRNPMYLGMAMLVSVPAVWRGQTLGAVVVAAFVAYITRFQILPEERALGEMFGEEYEGYKKRVGRWIGWF